MGGPWSSVKIGAGRVSTTFEAVGGLSFFSFVRASGGSIVDC